MEIHGGEHFELTANAMDGNRGQIQILISGCENVIFGPMAFNGEFRLNVTDVESLHVFQDAFAKTTFLAHFLRVADMRIHEGALAGASSRSKLFVKDSSIHELLPLRAVITKILFEHTKIERIKEHSFNAFGIEEVEFRDCAIDVIEKTAFTENVRFGC